MKEIVNMHGEVVSVMYEPSDTYEDPETLQQKPSQFASIQKKFKKAAMVPGICYDNKLDPVRANVLVEREGEPNSTDWDYAHFFLVLELRTNGSYYTKHAQKKSYVDYIMEGTTMEMIRTGRLPSNLNLWDEAFVGLPFHLMGKWNCPQCMASKFVRHAGKNGAYRTWCEVCNGTGHVDELISPDDPLLKKGKIIGVPEGPSDLEKYLQSLR